MAAPAFAGAAITFLASCAGGPPPPAAVAPAPVAEAPAAAASPAGPSAAPQQAAAVPAAAGARALIGITRENVVERFGAAGFVRRDGPAEVWRYRATDCFLEFFIYRDADGGQRVTHVDARNFVGRPASADTCLARLVAEKRG